MKTRISLQTYSLLLSFILIFQAGISFGRDLGGTDYTGTFLQKMYQKEYLSASQIEDLRKTQIVLIPGILSEAFLHNPDEPTAVNFSNITREYFEDQLNYLRNTLGLSVVRLNVTTKDPDLNKKRIYQKLYSAYTQKQHLTLIGHSMGGTSTVDALDMLLAKYPDALSIIDGIIFLQVPFYGSVAADRVEDDWLLRPLTNTLVHIMGGDPLTINYLRTDSRKRTMEREAETVQKILAQTKVLCVASYTGINTLLNPSRHAFGMEKNDGAVAVSSAILPGCSQVIIPHLDHCNTVYKLGPQRGYPRAQMTDVLLQILAGL